VGAGSGSIESTGSLVWEYWEYDLPFIQAGTYMDNTQRRAEIEAEAEADVLQENDLI
jgi:hypothetical protein